MQSNATFCNMAAPFRAALRAECAARGLTTSGNSQMDVLGSVRIEFLGVPWELDRRTCNETGEGAPVGKPPVAHNGSPGALQ